jgi:hypothetical protein
VDHSSPKQLTECLLLSESKKSFMARFYTTFCVILGLWSGFQEKHENLSERERERERERRKQVYTRET